MKYGFAIDNRKCIGCHACTTACKSEHEVPVGVNRTWVKQVEKGTFPDVRRLFSVMRCNHCTDAPCVTICPTESLYIREDGIVDFDKDRCIGCKSCMQACPYDALYIDPETHTAAKCNYCAHRIDLGLEPACVNVCPEEAIVSGDMDDSSSKLAILLQEQETTVRKPEKATQPNVFYIDAEVESLVPTASPPTSQTLWGSQSYGVGHFAKEAEKMAFSSGDVVAEVMRTTKSLKNEMGDTVAVPSSAAVLMEKSGGKTVYDTPDRGILWGWEVSAYVWTKAISTGVFIISFIAWATDLIAIDQNVILASIGIGLLFLILTGILLVMDLDQPKRFAYVLLRPNWNSWLVKGGYSITFYGGFLALLGILIISGNLESAPIIMWSTLVLAVLTAVYTAFLFAQAKGRDLWQSPALSMHMLVHAVMAGAAVLMIISLFSKADVEWMAFLRNTMAASLLVNVIIVLYELLANHPTPEAEITMKSITQGRYKKRFWGGAIILGCGIPGLLLVFINASILVPAIVGICVLVGIYYMEHVWVEAPQQIPLS